MSSWDKLHRILESGFKKHGEKPLTNLWLLNIMKQVEGQEKLEEERNIILENSIEIE